MIEGSIARPIPIRDHWERLEQAVKHDILVIGSGPTADPILNELSATHTVISTNDAYRDFNSAIHVSVDAHCIDDWYQERWPKEPVWVSRFADANGDPEEQTGECPRDKAQWWDIIPAKELGPMLVPHAGSGVTAIMIGWELARRLNKTLITIGIDLGVFWPRNGRGHFASFAMREKEQTGKNAVQYQYNYGPYQRQRKDLSRFGEYHRTQEDRPKVISLSAVDWTKLHGVGRIGEALDKVIIGKTIEYLEAQDQTEGSKANG